MVRPRMFADSESLVWGRPEGLTRSLYWERRVRTSFALSTSTSRPSMAQCQRAWKPSGYSVKVVASPRNQQRLGDVPSYGGLSRAEDCIHRERALCPSNFLAKANPSVSKFNHRGALPSPEPRRDTDGTLAISSWRSLGHSNPCFRRERALAVTGSQTSA